MLVESRFSQSEIEALRSVIGKFALSIFSGMLTVYESQVRILTPALMTLTAENYRDKDFLVLETTDVWTEIGNHNCSVLSRPALRKTDKQPVIPTLNWGSKHIVSGSDIDLGHGKIVKIEVFEYNRDVSISIEGNSHVVPAASDHQITFHRADSSPFSLTASFEFLHLHRGSGLLVEEPLNLTSRFILQ